VVKRRPALVLSGLPFNSENGQSILAMITSARASSWPGDILLTDDHAAGLGHPSMVRWKVFTLPNELILRQAGSLASTDREVVVVAARRYIAPSI
jgi:mRNA interferase MazF